MRNIGLLFATFFVANVRLIGAPTSTAEAPPIQTESSSIEKPRLGEDPKQNLKRTVSTETINVTNEPPVRVAPPKTNVKPTLGDIPDVPVRGKKEPQSSDIISPEDRKMLLENVAQEFYEKGELAIQEGRLQEARDLFERALTLQPSHVLARARLAATTRALDPPDPEPASKAQNPKEALIAKLSSELDQWIKNKSWDKADRVAKNILAVDPGNDKTKTKLRSIHRQLSIRAAERAAAREKAGDFQGAVDAYQVAINYYKDPIYTEKVEELNEKITDANNKKSQELYLQALDASQNGNISKAMALCRDALQLNPDNIQAERMLDRLQSKPNP